MAHGASLSQPAYVFFQRFNRTVAPSPVHTQTHTHTNTQTNIHTHTHTHTHTPFSFFSDDCAKESERLGCGQGMNGGVCLQLKHNLLPRYIYQRELLGTSKAGKRRLAKKKRERERAKEGGREGKRRGSEPL